MARKWLGKRNATTNASATGPAPSIAAKRISRTNPVRRDTSVQPPTVKIRSIIATHLYGHGRACPTLATTPARLAQTRVSTTLAKLGQARVSTPSRSFHVDALKTWIPATGAGMMTQHASLRNLSTQRTLHGGDDPVLRRLVEIAVHRQADDLLREPLGDREAAVRTGEMRVGFLLVQRLGIVDRRRNAFGFERRRVARDDFVAEDAQLLEQYRRLDGVEPSGQADAHIVVFVGVVAVHAQAGDQCGKLVVIGEDRSAVAVASE